MKIRQNILFTGGMNSDDEPRLCLPGEYIRAENLLVNVPDTGKVGSAVTMRGTSILNYNGSPITSYLPNTGVNTCINNECVDINNKGVIWFFHNSLGRHSIFEYISDDNYLQVILLDEPELGFSLSNKIYNPVVINGVLYWTDGRIPHQLNISKAVRYTSLKYGGSPTPPYYSLTAFNTANAVQTLDFIKHPPVYPFHNDLVVYQTDPVYPRNNLRGHLFQFAVRYVYDNNEMSVWSYYSNLALPQTDELLNGLWLEDQTVNNRILIQAWTGHETVKRIEIAARELNTGNFFMITRIDKYDSDGNILINSDTWTPHYFYNNMNGAELAVTDFVRPFDYVPIEAGTIEAIEKNMIIFGDFTEGYDNVDLDVSMGYTVLNDPILQNWQYAVQNFAVSPYFLWGGTFISYYITMPTTIIDYSILSFTIKIADPLPPPGLYGTFTFFHIKTPIETINDAYIALLAEINSGVTPYWNAILTGNVITIYSTFYNPSHFTVSGYVVITAQKRSILKKNSWHPFGIVYYDRAGRHGAVNPIDPVFLTETEYRYQYYDLRLLINHLAPDWAVQWSMAYAGNTIYSNYLQYYIQDGGVTDRIVGGVVIGKWIKINQAVQDDKDLNPKQNIQQWTWEKGDRIRLLPQHNTGNITDLEITDYDATNGFFVDIFDEMQWLGSNDRVEIYRPSKELAEKIYYEYGRHYDILPGGYHSCNTTNQAVGVSGVMTLTEGDSYLRFRYVPACTFALLHNVLIVEDFSVSDYYDSQAYSKGRPNVILREAHQQRLKSSMRHGGRLIENTFVNEINKFRFEDIQTLPEKWGQINGMRESGFTLKVYQEAKAHSIYIGRTEMKNPIGGDTLVRIDDVLGTVNTSEMDYGCQHKGSIVKNDRDVYFVDVINGKVCRGSANGLFPISDYKFVNYWRNKLSQVTTTTDIIAVFDNKRNQLLITLLDSINPSFNETVVFNEGGNIEKANRWSTAFTWTPQIYSAYGQYLYSFYNGDFYVHYTGDYLPALIKFCFNKNPVQIKVLDNIAIHSNNRWEVSEVLIPANEKYPLGMLSRIRAEKFKNKEGVFYADFLRDMLTNGISSVLNLITGRRLRSDVAQITMEIGSQATETTLFEITLDGTVSEKVE